MPIHPCSFEDKKTGYLNANIWSLEFVDCVLKTGGSSKAELEQKDSSNVELRLACMSASLLPPVFSTRSTNSELHTFALRHPVFLPSNECGWMGVTTQYLSISVLAESMYTCSGGMGMAIMIAISVN